MLGPISFTFVINHNQSTLSSNYLTLHVFEKHLSSIFTWHVVWKDHFVAKDNIQASLPSTILLVSYNFSFSLA